MVGAGTPVTKRSGARYPAETIGIYLAIQRARGLAGKSRRRSRRFAEPAFHGNSLTIPPSHRRRWRPGFISKVLDGWACEDGFVLDFSRPGKSTDNAFVESFTARPRHASSAGDPRIIGPQIVTDFEHNPSCQVREICCASLSRAVFSHCASIRCEP